jgi:hypothetical protein
VVWRGNEPKDPKTNERHECEEKSTPERIKRPTRHATSAYKIKQHQECELAYFYRFVKELPGADTFKIDAGKLGHAAIETVLVTRAREERLGDPVTEAELLAALDYVTARESWDAASLIHAREVLAKAAPRLDFSLIATDEHGPLVERGFEIPAGGDGIQVGGTVDAVEIVGDTVNVMDWKSGAWRDPEPHKLPAVGLYAAWAKSLWPDRNIVVTLDYLWLERQDIISWSPALEENAKAVARALVNKTRLRASDEKAWSAAYGTHCARCPFSSRCPEFKARSEEDASAHEPRTPAELAAAIHRFSPLATVATNKVKEWRDLLKKEGAALVGPSGNGMAGAFPIRISTRERSAYAVEASVYQVVDVYDPLETITLSPPEAVHVAEILANPPEPTPALVAALQNTSEPVAGVSPLDGVGTGAPPSGVTLSAEKATLCTPTPSPTPKKRGRPRKTPLLAEAEASVALDKGRGETVVSDPIADALSGLADGSI